MYQMAASGAEGHFLETLLREIADRVLMETDAALVMESLRWNQCWKQPESYLRPFRFVNSELKTDIGSFSGLIVLIGSLDCIQIAKF